MRREICVSKSIGLACRRKFTIFALFYFVFEGKFQVQAPWGAYIRRGDLTEGFLRYDFGGLIHGGAYFRNFMVSSYYLKYCYIWSPTVSSFLTACWNTLMVFCVIVFLGIRRSVFICFLEASRDCHLKTLALSQGNWEGLCSQLANWLLYLHASLLVGNFF